MIEKGEHGGSVVDCRTPEQDVGVGGGTLYSPKVLVIPRKGWLHSDMTEKLLTGMLSLNPQHKETNKS